MLSSFENEVKTISIHAPLAGSDVFKTNKFGVIALFQSTLPSRGATSAGYMPERY